VLKMWVLSLRYLGFTRIKYYLRQSIDLEDPARQNTRGLILVPTRELSEQVAAYLRGLLAYCDKDVTIANITSGNTAHLQR
jgi:ATP-dependent RNA helicase DDX56/DBP9